jgi:hypothetical protein
MSIRKLMVLTGLALAFAALIPASVQAKRGGTDRPFKAKASGTENCTNVIPGPSFGQFFGQESGRATHVGKYTLYFDGVGGPTDETFEHYEGTGNFNIVAANGDELFGDFDFHATGDPLAIDHGDVIEAIITGGTGRFAGASGTVTEIQQIHTISTEQEIEETGLSCATMKSRDKGVISY